MGNIIEEKSYIEREWMYMEKNSEKSSGIEGEVREKNGEDIELI